MPEYIIQQPELVGGTKARATDVNTRHILTVQGFAKLPTPHASAPTVKGFSEPFRVAAPTHEEHGVSVKDQRNGVALIGIDSGVANAYVVTLAPAPSAYTDGMELEFKPTNDNTGASTINVNGLGAKNIKRIDGTNPAAGDLKTGKFVRVRYDGIEFQILSATPGDTLSAAASAAAAAISESNAADSEAAAEAAAATIPDKGTGENHGKTIRVSGSSYVLTTPTSNINYLINSRFRVNQREYPADGVETLADNVYGHDMWCNRTGSTQKYSIDGSGNIDLDSIVLGQKNDDLLALAGETVTFSIKTGAVQIYGLGITEWTTVGPTTPHTWILSASGNSGWFAMKKASTSTFKHPKLELGSLPTPNVREQGGLGVIRCFEYLFIRTIAFGTSQNKTFNYEPMLLPVNMRTTPTGTVLNFQNIDSSAASSATVTVMSTSEVWGFQFDTSPGVGTFRFRIKFALDANYYT